MIGRRTFVGTAAVMVLMAAVLAVAIARRPAPPASRLSPDAQVRQELFDEIQPVQLGNCELKRFGEAHDGGYLLCGNLLGAVKAGYSYGISGYDGWGCDISRQLQVTVHQYDCFDLRVPSCPGGRTVFHGECIGTSRSVQDGRPFDTMAGQLANNGDGAVPVVVKIDVEGAEWDSFLLAPDSMFEHIDQLEVEFHQVGDEKFVATMRRLKRVFDIAHVHYNNFSCDPALTPFPSWAFEVLLVSKRLAKTDGVRAAAGPTPLDAPNNPNAADCQAAPSSGAL
jgi:hypothetical protein